MQDTIYLMNPVHQIRLLETDEGTVPFEEWYFSLKDKVTKVRIRRRLELARSRIVKIKFICRRSLKLQSQTIDLFKTRSQLFQN